MFLDLILCMHAEHFYTYQELLIMYHFQYFVSVHLVELK
jgi:hypothetical protein